MEMVIFDPNSKWTGIYTFMVSTGVTSVCRWSGETLEELKASGEVSPEAFLCPWDEAEKLSALLMRERLCKGPQRVTRERWWELLEILFPARWEQHVGDNSEHEIFMVPESIASTLYTFGVRIGEEYFTITEDCDIPAYRLIEACMELKNG